MAAYDRLLADLQAKGWHPTVEEMLDLLFLAAISA